MYITRVPNRNSPPAVLLRESYRGGGKVKNRTVANLSSWPEAKVEALARALKGLPPAGLESTFEIARSLPHGHVAAVLGTMRGLGLEELTDSGPSRQRDLVAAMITAAVIGGSSKLATARGLRAETAASSLGEVLGLGPCDEDDLYAAMDWLGPRQETIEDALAARHLSRGRDRACPRRRAGAAADRLWGAHHRRGDTGGGGGVQGQHWRPVHPGQPGRQAQGAVQPGPCRGRGGPGDDHQGADPRGPQARGAGLGHRAARPGHPGSGDRGRDPAHLVRRD